MDQGVTLANDTAGLMVYERQVALAKRLIEAKGGRCIWREPGTPTGSPAAPTPGVPTDHVVSIVFLSNNNRESLAGLLSMIAGTEIPTSGRRGLMPAVDFEPTLLGRVCIGDVWDDAKALSVVPEKGIDVVNVNGVEPILYFLRFQG